MTASRPPEARRHKAPAALIARRTVHRRPAPDGRQLASSTAPPGAGRSRLRSRPKPRHRTTHATADHPEILSPFAAELADKVDVIVALGFPAAAAAKAVGTVPIVVFGTGDPVGTGLAVSLAHPGGTVTGISDVAAELARKRLSLLKEAVPGPAPDCDALERARSGHAQLRYDVSAARAAELGIIVTPLPVRGADDFGQAMATMTEQPPDGLFMVADGLTAQNRKRIVDFAAAKRLPTMYEYDFIVREGGLMFIRPGCQGNLQPGRRLDRWTF